ncbi:hypothetical protein [Streptosporangium sp. NPDC049644]|uniref:hypothetical protein n=1 Tax=Streptosporangium sp. NPDC049644 TaxID=3155507 RepID=UPI00341B479D
MESAPRTELGEITSVGMELDESVLSNVSGGRWDEFHTGEYHDPPGVCLPDS